MEGESHEAWEDLVFSSIFFSFSSNFAEKYCFLNKKIKKKNSNLFFYFFIYDFLYYFWSVCKKIRKKSYAAVSLKISFKIGNLLGPCHYIIPFLISLCIFYFVMLFTDPSTTRGIWSCQRQLHQWSICRNIIRFDSYLTLILLIKTIVVFNLFY